MEKIEIKMRVGFRIRTPSVPRASIIWLAPAVKVVRPAARLASTLTAFASPRDGTQETRSEPVCLVQDRGAAQQALCEKT